MAPVGVSLLKRVGKWNVEAAMEQAVLLGGVLVVVSSEHTEELCILHCTSSKALSPPPPQGDSLL